MRKIMPGILLGFLCMAIAIIVLAENALVTLKANSAELLLPAVLMSAVLLFLSITIVLKLYIRQKKQIKEIDKLKHNLIHNDLASGEDLRNKFNEAEAIGRELHDRFCGDLVALKFLLSDFNRTSRDEIHKNQFEIARSEVDSIYTQLRKYSHQISVAVPQFQENYNLTEYVDRLKKQFNNSGSLQIHANMENATWKNIDPNKSKHILNILKEVLANTIKHANARNLEIKMTQKDTLVTLSVSDDGAGFHKVDKYGNGLKNISRNAEMMGGSLSITSNLKKGTCLCICFHALEHIPCFNI